MIVASRVDFKRNCKLEYEVRYPIRFKENTYNLTRIKFITNCIFLKKLLTIYFLWGI